MLNLLTLLAIGISILVCLSGCATKPVNASCQTLDWYELGRRDGTNGKRNANFNQHSMSCEGQTLSLYKSHYTSGRNAGLISYCSAFSGWNTGRAGQSYNKVCPKQLERIFLRNYKVGLKVFSLERRHTRLSDKIESIYSRLRVEKLDLGQKFRLTQQLEQLQNNKEGNAQKLSLMRSSIRFQ